jgi:hypothetical protein
MTIFERLRYGIKGESLAKLRKIFRNGVTKTTDANREKFMTKAVSSYWHAIWSAVILSALVSAAGGAYGQAQPATVGVGLVAASAEVDDLIQKAGNQGNYVVFNAASNLRVLIESLRLSARDVLGDGFSKLNNSQQQMFDNVQKGIASLKVAMNQPVEQARQTVEEIHQIANDGLPWMSNVAVIRAMPSILAPSAAAAIPFTVRGISLDGANPRLSFSWVQATRVGLQQQEATFSVPGSVFKSAKDKPILYSGKLTVDVKECTAFIFCHSVPKDYSIAVMVLAQQVASVDVAYNERTEQKIYDDPAKERSREFSYSSGDLTKMNYTAISQAPHAPGYFIDVDSINVSGGTERGRGHFELQNVTSGGFSAYLGAQSVIRGGRRIYNPPRKEDGYVSRTVKWREYRVDDVTTPYTNLQSTVLDWGASPVLDTLPSTSYAIAVKMSYFDGSHKTFVGNDGDQYVDVKWNDGTKQLLITPKKPESIAGIN